MTTNLIQDTLSRFVSSGQIAGCAARIMRNDEVLLNWSIWMQYISWKLLLVERNSWW